MNLINWFKALPSSILFSLQKKKRFVENAIDSKNEIYYTKLPVIEEIAGFRVNQELISKVLRIKYEQKYLQK
jgi:hypothetical protein